MTRRSPLNMALTLGVLALVACGENATEPETTRHLTSTGPVFAAVPNTWITRADIPRERGSFASAAVTNAAGQSIVYVIAGVTSAGGISPTVQAYNVATNVWTTRASLPNRVYATNGAGVINGKIYISGGIGIRRIADESLYLYDPATNTWTRVSSMPAPGFRGVTGVINNQLYVLTGCGGGADCDPFVPSAFYRYNPATGQWASLPTPTSTHEQGMGGVIGGKFYVVGGQDELNQLDVYDPATNTWTTRTPMPLGQFAAGGRWAGAGVAVGAKLFVIGGFQRDRGGPITAVRTNNVYNPATNTWSTKAPTPTSSAGIVASRVVLSEQQRIEVVGGSRPGTNLQYIP